MYGTFSSAGWETCRRGSVVMTRAATGAAERRGGCVLDDPPKNSVEYGCAYQARRISSDDGGRNFGLFRKKRHISYGYIQGLTPHAWGCTGPGLDPGPRRRAYPTRVGMHRGPRGGAKSPAGLTPHAWGCTVGSVRSLPPPRAYPTRVGMHPVSPRGRTGAARLPHTRGDAPRYAYTTPRSAGLTPHAWGCTLDAARRVLVERAYPTRVGMHPERRGFRRRSGGLPHTRGDAPRTRAPPISLHSLTPHAWGCTHAGCPAAQQVGAYPTRVGMHSPRR